MLLPFVEAIFELKFKEEPLYNKLRFNLARILLEKEIRPSDQFEWTRFESWDEFVDCEHPEIP